MINHLYTLLLNSPASEAPEMVSPDFLPVSLSVPQALIRHAIFPYAYPMEYRSCLAASLQRLVWAGPLAAEMLRIDSRSTIRRATISSSLLEPSMAVYDLASGVALPASPDYPVAPVGPLVPNPQLGLFRVSWEVSYSAAGEVQVVDLVAGTQSTKAVTFSGLESDLVNLGHGVGFRLLGVGSVPASLRCRIQAYYPMSIDLEGILARLTSDSRCHAIFNSVGYGLDASYLRSLFTNSDRIDVALPALLVAYASSFAKEAAPAIDIPQASPDVAVDNIMEMDDGEDIIGDDGEFIEFE